MTNLKSAAIRLHRIHKLFKRDIHAWKLSDKYLKKGHLDYNQELLRNRQLAVTAWKGLSQIEDAAVKDVQDELRNIGRTVSKYKEDGGTKMIFYIVGIETQMMWDLFTGLIIGH